MSEKSKKPIETLVELWSHILSVINFFKFISFQMDKFFKKIS